MFRNLKMMVLSRRLSLSNWSSVTQALPDPVFGVVENFRKDKNERKVNLSVGAYRDDEGKPLVLESVKKAEELIVKMKMNKEYAPILGIEEYNRLAAKLAFGDDADVINMNRNATVQSISGTGALRLGAEMIKRFRTENKIVYVPDPTWPNHPNIFSGAGLEVRKYRYYGANDRGLDESGLLDDIANMKKGSVIILHACAHNPTGVDPKLHQWEKISKAILERGILPFFDMAYQGFASGSLDNDASSLRMFIKHGHNPMVAQSFAKNMGLYGERVGAFTVVCIDSEEANKVCSQLKRIVRSIYSNPPLHGARIAQIILADKKLYTQWCDYKAFNELKQMSTRIISMRELLKQNLEKAGSKLNWSHVTEQIGMFCYTGLSPEQVTKLTNEHSIYLTSDGRISIAGLNSHNVAYVAQCIHQVTQS